MTGARIVMAVTLAVLIVWFLLTVLVAAYGRDMDQTKPLWNELIRLWRGR